MSNKLLKALLLTAAVAALVPFIGRADNIGSPVGNTTTPAAKPVTEAKVISTDDEPQVVSLEVTPSGFEPLETIARRGRFLILLQNRTGRKDLNFWLARENEGRLAESEPQKRDWKAHVQLSPGAYIIGETNHPEWKSTIRVTN